MSDNQTLTVIRGIRVGHAHDADAITGCTVILCPPGTVGGVDQRGGAPGTRETDLLQPMHLVQHVNAILLTGGSAFGLAAADGVMRYLEARGIGYETPVARVPIVPAAVLFDLDLGRADRRPDAAMGFAACEAASDAPVTNGSVGAGMGATVGRLLGKTSATKGGVGSASMSIGPISIAALIAVNAVGDVVDSGGNVLAGVRNPSAGPRFPGTLNLMRQLPSAPANVTNTVIGVVATNARMDKEAVNKMAQMGQDGLAQAIRPAHTMFDGDTLFGLATGEIETPPQMVGVISAFAAEVVAAAIRNAVLSATGMGGVPAASDLD